MADTAVARLRGILARDHDAATIEQLLTDVCSELAGARGYAAAMRERLMAEIKAALDAAPVDVTDEGRIVAAPRPAPPRDPALGLCGQRAHLPTGEPVHCTKAAGHTGPWHKQRGHHWRTIFGKAGHRHEPFTGHSAHELGTLRVRTRDLGDVLRQIVASSSGGCACGDIAAGALVDMGREAVDG